MFSTNHQLDDGFSFSLAPNSNFRLSLQILEGYEESQSKLDPCMVMLIVKVNYIPN